MSKKIQVKINGEWIDLKEDVEFRVYINNSVSRYEIKDISVFSGGCSDCGSMPNQTHGYGCGEPSLVDESECEHRWVTVDSTDSDRGLKTICERCGVHKPVSNEGTEMDGAKEASRYMDKSYKGKDKIERLDEDIILGEVVYENRLKINDLIDHLNKD